MEPIRVLLADDHTLFRKGVRTLLEQMHEIEMVDEARDLVPDVILMDIRMPEISGIEATRHILQDNPHIGVILLTMFDDPESVFSGMRAGARGYVLKEAEPDELRRTMEAAYRGEVILCRIIAKRVLDHFGEAPRRQQPGLPYEELTQRGLKVLQLATKGLSNKEIAANLIISEKTVKNHIANIFSKLQVNDRTQTVLYALRKGLVTISPEED